MRIVFKWFDRENRLRSARVINTERIVAIDVDEKDNLIGVQVMDGGELINSKIDLDDECITDNDNVVGVRFDELRRVMLADLLDESDTYVNRQVGVATYGAAVDVITWSYHPYRALDTSLRHRFGFDATGWERTV